MTDRRHCRKAFLNGEHTIADAGIDSVQRDDGIADGFFPDGEGLDEEDLLAFVTGFLLGGDDLSDNSGEDHDIRCTSSTIATIVASVGTSRPLNANDASLPRQT